ncbi:MAG: type III-B CRISPR-associated protein Cas10/Cmr2 [Armatimonadota bacterium]
MSEYLFSISIGPVQEFIAAARRTADLGAGSQLLKRLAMHIADEIDKRGGQLIFPAGKDTPGPNKVVAQIATDDPAKMVDELRESAITWLWDEWQNVRRTLQQLPIDDHLAEEQVKNFLEFYAAWVPVNGNYVLERERVELLLAGRKALRDFRQIPCRPGRWKSPLDPSRDCVIELEGTRVPAKAEGDPLYLKRTEYLDAISILKRVMGVQRAGNVPSTSRMAAKAILPIARQKASNAVEELEQIANGAPGPIDIGDLMFPTRVQEEMDTADELLRGYLQQHRETISCLRQQILQSLTPALHECPPYYAILVADGDHMGQLIRQQKTPEAHRQLSQKLADFAQQAERIVQGFKGYPIYAGGDDLLAMLPVNTALHCAVELADAFSKQVGGTLSAGVAIVHRMEMLQEALQWAREAEGLAKTYRNALAIALHTRGGAPVLVATSRQNDPYMESWARWIKAFRQGLTHGFPYELLYLAREAENASLSKDSIRAEALRIFERKQGRESAGHTQPIRQWLQEEVDAINHANDLRRFAQRLIIARFLAGYPNGEVQS